MALYSVWDWDRNAWGVYRTPTPVSVGDDPLPHSSSGDSAIGAAPSTGVKALPSNARLIGYDHLARGEVRRRSGALGDNGDDAGRSTGVTGNGWLMFAVGVAVATGWFWWKDKK